VIQLHPKPVTHAVYYLQPSTSLKKPLGMNPYASNHIERAPATAKTGNSIFYPSSPPNPDSGGPLSVSACPVARGILESLARGNIKIRDLSILRVGWLRTAKKGLQREKRGTQREVRPPIFLEDAHGDSTCDGGDVRVVDLCDEFHLRRDKGIGIG